VAQAA
jgi:hypothetical protein